MPSAAEPLPLDANVVGDQWMLCILVVLWSVFTFSVCVRSKRYTLTAAGFTLPKKLLEKEHARSLFIYECCPPASGTTIAPHRMRSFEDFCQKRAPPTPSFPFQRVFRISKRWDIYKSVIHGAIISCWPFVVFCGLFALVLSWVNKNGEALGNKFGTDWFAEKYVSSNMKACAEVQNMLFPPATFILALVLNAKLSWFNDTMSKMWSVQECLHCIAHNIGTSMWGDKDLPIQRAKFRIYRYCNLEHFFLYQSIAVVYNKVSLQDLVMSGLLSRDEADLLDRVESKTNAVRFWLTAVLQQLVNDARIDNDLFVSVIMPNINELNTMASSLVKEMTRAPPISFIQLMQIMIDLLLLLTPPATAFSLRFQGVNSSVMLYVWPCLSSMTVALFYQGAMTLIAALSYPFGISADNLRPDFVLMTTEHAVFEYLTAELPKSLQEKYDQRSMCHMGSISQHSSHRLESGKTLADVFSGVPEIKQFSGDTAPKDASSRSADGHSYHLTPSPRISVEHVVHGDTAFSAVLPGAVQD